jgi:DNA repair exonuclease SbcCD ATPase subunit
MTLRSLDLQQTAALTARLKSDEELRDAVAYTRACARTFLAALCQSDAGALAWCALQAGDEPKDGLADVRQLRMLQRRFLDWAEDIEHANTVTRDRCAQGRKAIELELIGCATRQREIAAEIERIETALGECESESERKRRSMEAVGVPAALAATLAPDRDRQALAARRADLLEEDAALSRFVTSFDLRKLPKSFGPWLEAWKTRVGMKASPEAPAEAA